MSSPPREFEGRDLVEALQEAARTFGVRRQDLWHEILEEGRRGFLGIGSRQCVIRACPKAGVTSRGADDGDQPPPRRDVRPSEDHRPRHGGDRGRGRGRGRGGRGRQQGQGGGGYQQASSSASRRLAGPRQGGSFGEDDHIPARLRDRGSDRPEPGRGRRRGPHPDDRAGRPQHSRPEGGHPAHGRRRRRGRGGGRGPADASVASRPRREDDEARVPAPTVPATDAHAADLCDLVEEIVAHWGLELEVTSRIDADTVWISFTGADAALLTDDDGRILEALQYLVSKMSSRLLADNVRVLLDAAGFRHERDEALRAMAFDAAARAIERGKPIRLEPLNAYERRVIHIALQDKPGVRTYSLGRGYFKRVTIEPVEAADARADQPGAAAHAGTAAPAGAAAADLDNDDTPAPSDDDDE